VIFFRKNTKLILNQTEHPCADLDTDHVKLPKQQTKTTEHVELNNKDVHILNILLWTIEYSPRWMYV